MADIVWAYRPQGGVKHALRAEAGTALGHSARALCGRQPPPYERDSRRWWRHRETLEQMRPCRHCLTLAARTAGGAP